MAARGKQTLNKLTDREVRTAKPGVHMDGGGLRLRVLQSGVRRYEFRFQIDGRVRDMFIGNAESITLANARDLATEARKMARAKIDPIDQAKSRREADKAASIKAKGGPTFGEATTALLGQRKAAWSDSNTKTWKQSLRKYCGQITDKPCEQIETGDIKAIFDPLWHSRSDLAKRLRYRIEAVLSSARSADDKNQYFSREWVNPARRKDHLLNIFGKPAKREINGHKYMPPETLPAFISMLREKDTNTALLLEFIALTAARAGEARLMTWDEIDADKNIWNVPAIRMKGRVAHTVPLSPRAVEIIEEMGLRAGNKGYVFAGTVKDSAVGETMPRWLMRKMGVTASPHGFRKSFKTWATEAGIRDDVSEACLAHADPNKVRAAYQMSDLMNERRNALEAWATFCDGGHAENVLPMRRA